jgi:hypothetical protein
MSKDDSLEAMQDQLAEAGRLGMAMLEELGDLKEAHARLKALCDARDTFIEDLRSELKLAKAAAVIAARRADDLRETVAREDQELADEDEREAILRAKNEALSAELAVLRRKYESLQVEQRESARDFSKDVDNQRRKAMAATEAADAARKAAAEVADSFAVDERRLSVLGTELDTLRSRAEAAEKESAAARKGKAAAEEALEQLRDESRDRILQLEVEVAQALAHARLAESGAAEAEKRRASAVNLIRSGGSRRASANELPELSSSQLRDTETNGEERAQPGSKSRSVREDSLFGDELLHSVNSRETTPSCDSEGEDETLEQVLALDGVNTGSRATSVVQQLQQARDQQNNMHERALISWNAGTADNLNQADGGGVGAGGDKGGGNSMGDGSAVGIKLKHHESLLLMRRKKALAESSVETHAPHVESSESDRKAHAAALQRLEELERKIRELEGRGEGKFETPLWWPDQASDVCLLCDKPFGILTRRHHCRNCGKLVCADCLSGKIENDHKIHDKGWFRRSIVPQRIRVCKECLVLDDE